MAKGDSLAVGLDPRVRHPELLNEPWLAAL